MNLKFWQDYHYFIVSSLEWGRFVCWKKRKQELCFYNQKRKILSSDLCHAYNNSWDWKNVIATFMGALCEFWCTQRRINMTGFALLREGLWWSIKVFRIFFVFALLFRHIEKLCRLYFIENCNVKKKRKKEGKVPFPVLTREVPTDQSVRVNQCWSHRAA